MSTDPTSPPLSTRVYIHLQGFAELGQAALGGTIGGKAGGGPSVSACAIHVEYVAPSALISHHPDGLPRHPMLSFDHPAGQTCCLNCSGQAAFCITKASACPMLMQAERSTAFVCLQDLCIASVQVHIVRVHEMNLKLWVEGRKGIKANGKDLFAAQHDTKDVGLHNANEVCVRVLR